MAYLYEQVEENLGRMFGPNVGLNADWSVSAWYVANLPEMPISFFITDNENDSYSLVQRTYSEEDNDEIIDLRTWEINSPADIRTMKADLRKLADARKKNPISF